MSSTEQERLNQLNTIQKVIQTYESQVNDLLQDFGWTKDKLPKYKEEEDKTNTSDLPDCSSNANVSSVNCSVDPIDLETIVNIGNRIDAKRSETNNFTDLNKLRRDLKRRRVKYRTTKTAPLTYTEELRELINLQMELIAENQKE